MELYMNRAQSNLDYYCNEGFSVSKTWFNNHFDDYNTYITANDGQSYSGARFQLWKTNNNTCKKL